MSAVAAQNRRRTAFADRPNFRRMICMFGVAPETRKPFTAAFEFDGDNINLAAIMDASRLRVNVRADHF